MAEKLDTEIINADSMQVYKYFDIGTAKPSREIRQRVVHHLIDILEPDEEFNAFDFKVRALEQARKLMQKGKTPIMAGGTGLYLKVLTQNHDCAVPISAEIREKIQWEIQESGLERMYEELMAIDPAAASTVTPADALRIARAVGVYRQTGKKFSDFHGEEVAVNYEFPIKTFLIQWDRKDLYSNIDRRVDQMIENGLVEEVKNLLKRGYAKTLKPFKSIGYAQILNYLDGNITLDRAVYEIKRETRHYAKRQITWFKKVPDTVPIPAGNADTPKTLMDKILSRLPQAAVWVLAAILLLGSPAFTNAADLNSYENGVKYFRQGSFSRAENHLLAVVNSSENPLESKRSRYLLGHIYLKKNETEKAAEFFTKAIKDYPEIEDYTRLTLADALYQSGKKETALEQTTQLLDKFPQTLTYPRTQFLRADILKSLGKTSESIEVLDQAVKKISAQDTFAEFKSHVPAMILRQALFKLELGLAGDAYTLYRKLYIYFPSHPITIEALPEIKRLASLPDVAPAPLSLKERSIRIDNLMEDVRYDQVIDEVEEIKRHTSPLPDHLYLDLANAYKGLKLRDKANEVLETFLKIYPNHADADDARYNIGRNLWNLGKETAAIHYLKKVGKKRKSSGVAIKSQFIIGRIHEGEKQFPEALKAYNRLVSKHGTAEYAQWSAWRMGWIHYLMGDYNKALHQFKENARSYPAGDFIESNLYWQAKSAEKLGEKDSARKIYAEIAADYPYTFSGIRAKEKLKQYPVPVKLNGGNGLNITSTALTDDDEGSHDRLDRAFSQEEKFHYTRAVELTGLGFFEYAKLEIFQLEKSVRKNLDGVMWLSGLYNQAQAYAESVRLLQLYKNYRTRKGEKDLSEQFWKHFFPPAYFETIQVNSLTHAIDPWFVKGLIRQESLFDAQSLSRAGARGLMQIMPETGRRLYSAGENGKPFDQELLFDPELNIQLGTKYLRQLHERFGNNGTYLLISYNAGPHVLQKWLKRFEHIDDPDVFIESIPYPETRKYVKHVLRNHGIYKLLYGKV